MNLKKKIPLDHELNYTRTKKKTKQQLQQQQPILPETCFKQFFFLQK